MDKEIKKSTKINDKYIRIIGDENKRLSSQVERVLQIASLEKDITELNFRLLDLHLIVQKAIDIISFKIEKRNGLISCKLDANNFIIKGNEVDLLNVFNNLLDNANKYCTTKPKILVSTYNKDNKLCVEISDNGIGISKENIKRVFDKFYREPQGNIHNVKGFGLGLSYVKNMLHKHDSTVIVSSVKNKSSLFLIKFNYVNG